MKIRSPAKSISVPREASVEEYRRVHGFDTAERSVGHELYRLRQERSGYLTQLNSLLQTNKTNRPRSQRMITAKIPAVTSAKHAKITSTQFYKALNEWIRNSPTKDFPSASADRKSVEYHLARGVNKRENQQGVFKGLDADVRTYLKIRFKGDPINLKEELSKKKRSPEEEIFYWRLRLDSENLDQLIAEWKTQPGNVTFTWRDGPESTSYWLYRRVQAHHKTRKKFQISKRPKLSIAA